MVKEKFRQVDDGLIDHCFQPVIDWLAEHTAFDCYAVARLCTDLSAFAWVLSQSNGLIAAIHAARTGEAAFRASLLLLGLGALMVLRTLFQRSGGAGAANCANPLRAGMHVHRFICVSWLLGLMFKAAIGPSGLDGYTALAVGLCGTAAVYFASCSNRPPARRTSRPPQDDRLWAKAN
jgi:hypothetical protein